MKILTFLVKYLGQTEHLRRAFSHSHLALEQGLDDCAARAPNTIAALLPSLGSELLILFPEKTVPETNPHINLQIYAQNCSFKRYRLNTISFYS